MDKGPWKVETWDGRAVLCSDDFTHDVTLRVEGDFEGIEERTKYVLWLASVLNTRAAPEVSDDELSRLIENTAAEHGELAEGGGQDGWYFDGDALHAFVKEVLHACNGGSDD